MDDQRKDSTLSLDGRRQWDLSGYNPVCVTKAEIEKLVSAPRFGNVKTGYEVNITRGGPADEPQAAFEISCLGREPLRAQRGCVCRTALYFFPSLRTALLLGLTDPLLSDAFPLKGSLSLSFDQLALLARLKRFTPKFILATVATIGLVASIVSVGFDGLTVVEPEEFPG